jgi:hypothetical protein
MADTQPRNKPTHDVCYVKERKGQKAYWTTIGAAWAHKDQMGLNVQLDFIPLDTTDGKLVIRVRAEKPATGEAAR